MCPMKGKNHVSTGIGVQTMQKGYLCELKLIIAGPPRLPFIIARELEGRMYFGTGKKLPNTLVVEIIEI